MGAVFLARDPDLDREVAIKLVKDDLSDDEELRERFSREARSAARLRHPNIVTVFDIGEQDGCPFIAMEYMPGESLADKLKRRASMELSQVIVWMESLCLGLAHAHRYGIVHRDIKPANLMVDAEGTLKIVDFGIARLADSQMTREGVLVGTINYMSPEQILGHSPDHRADIYAVGAVFYELLTGKKAFPGSIQDGVFTRICQTDPEPIEHLRPGIDTAVAVVVARALVKEPDARYQDLTAMARDIALIRVRLGGSTSSGITLPMGADEALMQETMPASGARSHPGIVQARLAVEADDQQRRARVQEEQERAERLRVAMDRAREAASQGAFEQAIRAAQDALAIEPGLVEAHDIIAQARASVAERQRQAAIVAATRVIDAARTALEGGDVTGATELLDAVKAPSTSLEAAVAELRGRIAEVARQRQRRAEILVDAAELAMSQGDVTKASSLVEDAARADAAYPGLVTLRAQIDAHQRAVVAAAEQRQTVDAALREANGALARGDFARARECVAQVQQTDPGNWAAASLVGRIQQAARAAEERAQGRGREVARAQRRGSMVVPVIIVVVVAAIVVLYFLL